MGSAGHKALFRLGRAAIFCFAALPSILFGVDLYPSYSALSIVNAATQTVEALAPNTIATVYGTNLSFTTSAAGTAKGSTLPTTLEGVTVYVNGLLAPLFYVSPTQINLLIPYELTAGSVTIAVARQGAAGPSVKLQLNSSSPAFFQWNGFAIGTHLTGALITPDAPAVAGEIIVIYATGLGKVSPNTTSGRLVTSIATVPASSQFQMTLSGVVVPASNILYAGLAPGFAGLYQINVRLPDALHANPEVRLGIAGQTSPALLQLPATGTAAVAAN